MGCNLRLNLEAKEKLTLEMKFRLHLKDIITKSNLIENL